MNNSTPSPPCLQFWRNGVVFGAPATELAQVSPLKSIRSLPTSPPWFVGVADFRGQVIPILDPAALATGTVEPPQLPVTAVAVGKNGRASMAFTADRVGRVAALPEDPPADWTSAEEGSFLGRFDLTDGEAIHALDIEGLSGKLGLSGRGQA